MLLHSTPFFRIYFGNAEDELNPKNYLNLPSNTVILEHPYFESLQKIMHLDDLIFLKQVHGMSGLVCTETTLPQIRSFKNEGDFLMTDLYGVGLGVMTADCLPIVFYDTRNHAVAIVHAGWKGSAQGVVLRALEMMQEEYNTHKDHLQIFFGPSAKVCCYEFGEDMIDNFDAYPYAMRAFQWHGDRLYFDLPGFNKLQLESVGVKKKAFHVEYSICTMCDEKFYSHRRQKEQAGRQMTVVSLQ
jgi:YfiH family protein